VCFSGNPVPGWHKNATLASYSMSERITEGRLAANLFRFGAPLALGMALQTAFNLVDATLIAQLPPGEREAAIGAVGVCDQVAAVGSIISYGISTATATLIATAKGAGDTAAIKRLTSQSFLLVGALSVLFGLFALLAPFFVTDVMGLKGQVALVSSRYLRVMLSGSFTIFLLLHCTSIQRALGSAKTGVALLVVGNIFNFIFAVIGLYGDSPPRHWESAGQPVIEFLAWGAPIARALSLAPMGMQGAAWATVLARALVLVPMLYVLQWRFRLLQRSRDSWRSDWQTQRQLLAVAWPSCAQFVVRIGLGLFVNALVARTFTNETDQTASTAMGLVFRVDTLALFAAVGWGTAAQTFVGQNLGAGKPTRAYASGLWASAYGLVTACILWLAISTFAEPVLQFFGKDARAVALGVQYIGIAAIGYLPLSLGIVLNGAMIGAARARLTLLLDVCVLLLVQVPLCLLAAAAQPPSFQRLIQAVLVASLLGAAAYSAAYLMRRWLRPVG
jgi:putative MATE family efflux protein